MAKATNPTSLNLTRLRNSVNENANSATALNIARFTLNDPDGGANVVSLSGAHASFFDLSQSNGTYTLFLKPDVGFNFETTPTLDLFINSYTAGTDPAQALSVKYDLRVLNVNEAPIIGSDGAGATARVVANTNSLFVTDIDATDPDAGDSVTYSVSGGPHRDLFSIDTNGVLSFKSLPQEGQYSVLVRATDRAGLSDSQLLTINTVVSPEITSLGGANQASVKVDENSTVVTTVQANDPNGRALSYSLKGGADAGLFNIDAITGQLSFKSAPNFEVPADQGADNGYNVVVRASNSLGGFDEQALTVNVVDVKEDLKVGYYYTNTGQGEEFQVNEITNAGATAVKLDTLSTVELSQVSVIYIMNNYSGVNDYTSNFSNVENAVFNGSVLIVHDRDVAGNQNSSGVNKLPGFGVVNATAILGGNLELTSLGLQTIATGPGGVVNNQTLDGGAFGYHGFVRPENLAVNADVYLTTGNPSEAVTFGYAYGRGYVVYSTIPLDAYSSGGTFGTLTPAEAESYATNLISFVGVRYGSALVPLADLAT